MLTSAKKKFVANALIVLIFCVCALGLFALQAFTAGSAGTQGLGSLPDRSLPTPSQSEQVRIGMIEFNSTVRYNNQFQRTVEAIRLALSPRQVVFDIYPSAELERKIKAGELDFFLASSGFYWRMMPYGARSIATQANSHLQDPNHSAGVSFVVKVNAPYQHIEDLRGKRLGASYPTAFYGYRIGLAELGFHGENPYQYFSFVQFAGTPQLESVLQLLATDQVDVVFLPVCAMEELPRTVTEQYRIIDAKPTAAIGCQISTRTYPGHTLAALHGVDPEIARQVAQTVLSLPRSPDAEWWSVATDFTSVDRLYRVLKIGPYKYLNDTSLKDWVREHQGLLSLALIVIAGLSAHGIRANWLVQKRTEELQATARKEKALEAKFRKTNVAMERLQKASTVGMLSSMITHELAQPLSSLRHYLDAQQVLLNEEAVNRNLLVKSRDKMSEQTERMIRIVEQVRRYGKNETRKEHAVNLSSLMGKLCTWLTLEGPQYRLETTVASDLWVMGNELEIELALWNLFKNAREAALAVADGYVTIDAHIDGENVVLSVKNAGVVLSREAVDDFLTPLMSQKQHGLGLGLPIVVSIIELSGGHLLLDPISTGGLAVTVVLPLAKSAQEGEPERAQT